MCVVFMKVLGVKKFQALSHLRPSRNARHLNTCAVHGDAVGWCSG
jgi:hypothetical protein